MLSSKVVFERKILRRIYGPVKGKELWRIRRNDELEAILKGKTLSDSLKAKECDGLVI